jgi:ParB/RepB/Spo0J family partition protein
MTSIDRLSPDPRNVRVWDGDADANNQLAASIHALGIIQPIIVRPDPAVPAGYIIVAGHRRWRAAMVAGLQAVPTVLYEGPADTTVTQLAENIVRAPMRTADVWSAVTRLLAENWSATDIGVAFNISERRIRQFQLMGQLPEPIVAHIRETNDIPRDDQIRRLVYGDQKVLLSAFKAVAKGFPGGAIPWHELVSKVTVHRIDVGVAVFKLTDEDRVAFDVREDFFEQGDHLGYAHNVAAFMERQVAEITVVLEAWRKRGFIAILVRPEQEHSAAQLKGLRVSPLVYDKVHKLPKAQREGKVIVADLRTTGRVHWDVMELAPERAKLAALEGPAAAPALVTKACDTLIDVAKRRALAEHLKHGEITRGALVAALAHFLRLRLGWHVQPEGLYGEDGTVVTDSTVRGAAEAVLAEACMSTSITLDEIERLGATLEVVPQLALTEEELSMLKKPALAAVFKARGVPMAEGTQKAARAALVREIGVEGVVTLLPGDLPALGYTLPVVRSYNARDDDDAANDNDADGYDGSDEGAGGDELAAD